MCQNENTRNPKRFTKSKCGIDLRVPVSRISLQPRSQCTSFVVTKRNALNPVCGKHDIAFVCDSRHNRHFHRVSLKGKEFITENLRDTIYTELALCYNGIAYLNFHSQERGVLATESAPRSRLSRS